MDFTTVISTRRAIRAFKSDPVPQPVLGALTNALRLAPSANNEQPLRFVFVQDAAARRRIAAEACHQEFIGDAPLIVVATCEPDHAFDVAIAIDHMILAATDAGLGTCWVGWFEKAPIRSIVGIPQRIDVPIIVPIGYAAEAPDARERKALDEIIGYDRY